MYHTQQASDSSAGEESSVSRGGQKVKNPCGEAETGEGARPPVPVYRLGDRSGGLRVQEGGTPPRDPGERLPCCRQQRSGPAAAVPAGFARGACTSTAPLFCKKA